MVSPAEAYFVVTVTLGGGGGGFGDSGGAGFADAGGFGFGFGFVVWANAGTAHATRTTRTAITGRDCFIVVNSLCASGGAQ